LYKRYSTQNNVALIA